ncbi:MAG: FHA domain-containing protein [Bdellovibrionales bacterium]|nr:FHA domain-containing protein [Bdellovibrionales bacterium]
MVVPDDSLSRQHCQIEFSDGEFYITDLASANGVYIHGERVPPNEKTHFTTFIQLSIASMDCTVMDDGNEAQTSSRPHDSTDSKTFVTRIDRSLSAPKANSGVNKKIKSESAAPFMVARKVAISEKKTKEFNPKSMGLILLVALGGISYFQFSSDEENVTDIPAPVHERTKPTVVARPVVEQKVEDVFLSTAGYLEKNSRKQCQSSQDICTELQLTQEGEGVAMEGNEVFIFMNPDVLLENPVFESIKGLEGARFIIAIYSILKSQVLIQMQQGKYTQIHLLVIDKEKAIQRIFRFHPKHFDSDGKNKMILMEKIASAIKGNQLDSFWGDSQELIPALTPVF